MQMKLYLAILATLLFADSLQCADPKLADEDSLRSYMAGEYDLIVRKADSSATYAFLSFTFDGSCHL